MVVLEIQVNFNKIAKENFSFHLKMDNHTKARYGGVLAPKLTATNGVPAINTKQMKDCDNGAALINQKKG
jgi:hypothetical protein